MSRVCIGRARVRDAGVDRALRRRILPGVSHIVVTGVSVDRALHLRIFAGASHIVVTGVGFGRALHLRIFGSVSQVHLAPYRWIRMVLAVACVDGRRIRVNRARVFDAGRVFAGEGEARQGGEQAAGH